jgi:heme iron utilization protein
MQPGDLRLLRDLLRKQRLLNVAVVVGGEPVAGLVPFLASPDLASLAVHVSALARHAKGLGGGAAWSGVVHVPDQPDVDPLQVPRVTLHGTSRRFQDPQILDALRQKWVQRFRTAEMTVGLGDFAFYSLDIAGGRLIAGLGRALNFDGGHLEKAAALEDGGA